MPTKKNNNLENIQRNLVSNPSCRGHNKTIMSTHLSRLNTEYIVLVHLIYLLNAFHVFRLKFYVILHTEYEVVHVK